MSHYDELMDAIELNTQALFCLAQHVGELRDTLDRLSQQDQTLLEKRSNGVHRGL